MHSTLIASIRAPTATAAAATVRAHQRHLEQHVFETQRRRWLGYTAVLDPAPCPCADCRLARDVGPLP